MNRVLVRIRELGKNQKENTILARNINPRIYMIFRAGLALILSGLIMTGIFLNDYSEKVNRSLAENLIRFHVVANSDSEEDQQIKRDVRDKIIEYMKFQLKDSGSLEQTKYIISNNLGNIANIAEEVIADAGKDYKVKAELGSYPFPTKAYGDIVLPAGNYQALRVVIGNGEGNNWWCVLFPPLCFVDATHGTVPESAKESLKEQLSAEEYLLITSSDSEKDVPVKIKFKIVEIIQNSKNKFSAVLSKLFDIKE